MLIAYFKDHFPQWSRIEYRSPTVDESISCLKNADVFVYSGHGSSLQFLQLSEIVKTESEAVLLLYGCQSVGMKFNGLLAEPTAAHLNLTSTKCPGILGAMTIVTDQWIDFITLLIMELWFRRSECDVQKILNYVQSKNKFKVDEFTNFVSGPHFHTVLSKIRSSKNIELRIQASLIYRGLPLINA